MKNLILSKEAAERKMQRIALEIAEEMFGQQVDLIIIGVAGSGMVVAKQIHRLLFNYIDTPMFLISCTLNKKAPGEILYSDTIDFTNKNILLVDDVTNSGKTLLFALKPLLQFLPKSIRTMSLVERMHKSFPVKIDFIGLSVATTLQEHIQVEVENDEITGAYIL